MIPSIKVWCLGLTSFQTAFQIQSAICKKHLLAINSGTFRTDLNTLLFLEHKPVYTVGIRDSIGDEEITSLKELGAEFYKTNRGGLITFHGPGQLVVYPILHLKQFEPSVRWYVEQLEETVIRICSDYGLMASRSPHTGVWIGDKKIAAIGVHASRYVTTHGIAMNCNTDLKWFNHIVPCGIEGKGVTSLTEELKKTHTVAQVAPKFLEHFQDVFKCKAEMMEESEQGDILKQIYAKLIDKSNS